jgi:hypothetical protein
MLALRATADGLNATIDGNKHDNIVTVTSKPLAAE